MINLKFIFPVLLFLLNPVIVLSQKTINNLPKDFILEYKYEGGSSQFGENLSVNADSGIYTCFDHEKRFDINFNEKNKEQFLELYKKLLKFEYSTIKIPDSFEEESTGIMPDYSLRLFYIKENDNIYIFSDEIIKKSSEKDAIKIQKLFEEIQNFTKELRK